MQEETHTMSFNDIFKSSFLESVTEFSPIDTVLGLAAALVIMAVTSNVVLSLGMVGALSIVRFRAAIKEPVEIVFLFWSLAVGIVIGAGMIPLAIIGSVLIGLILLLFANRKIHSNPYILVLTVSAAGIELTAELRTRDASTAFVNQIQSLSGVESATLVSYNGEYLS